MRSKSHFRRWRGGLPIVVSGVATVGLLSLLWSSTGGLDLRILSLTAADVQGYAEAWAPWSAVVSIALMVLHSFVPLPAEIIAVANGMMFGLFGGVVVTWAGAMLGAVLSFGIARGYGRPALRWLVSERRWQAIDKWELRPMSLLIARLIPVISFNLINYGAGLARVRWWPFLWTTGIGILPLTVVSVLLGDTILQASWTIAGIIIASAAVLLFVLRHGRMQRLINSFLVPVADGSANGRPQSSDTKSINNKSTPDSDG